MSQQTRPRFYPQLEALEDRAVPSATVQRPIADFLNQQGTTMVVITHDREIAATFPRTVSLRDGRVVADERDGRA